MFLSSSASLARLLSTLITAVLLTACSGPDSAEDNLRLGRDAAVQGRFDEALLYYQIALRQEPASLGARYELGVLNGQLGDMPASERFLIPVVEANFRRDTSVPALASAYYQQNKVFALETLLNQQTYQSAGPELSLQLALFRVLWLHRTGDAALASKALDALGAPAENCERCQLTRAYLDSNGRPVEAMQNLRSMLENYPDNAEAHLLMGQLSLGLRNPRQAYTHFSQFKRLQPRATYAELLLALSAVQMEALAGAEKHVDRLLALSPRQPVANHLKALLAFAEGNYDKALLHAEESTNRGLKAPANFLIAGVSAFHLQQLEIAYDHLGKAVTFYPDNAELQRLLLALQLKFGYLADAQESYFNQDVRSVRDVLFGNAMAYQLIQDGQFSAAGNVLAYLEKTPVSTPSLRLQTEALRTQLHPESQLAKAQVLAVDMRSGVSNLATLLILLQSGALEEAQEVAQAWLKVSPDNIDALNSLAYVYQKTSRVDEAAALYARALAVDPENLASLLFAAESAASLQEYEQARSLYLRVLSVNPRSLVALQSLLLLTFAQNEVPDLNGLLTSLSVSSLSEDQVVSLADALFQWQQYEALEQLLQRYGPQQEWSDMLWMVWLKNSYYRSGPENFLAAFEAYSKLNTLPDHVLFALSIVEQQGDWQLELELLNRVDDTVRQMPALQLARAVALMELEQYDAANKIVDQHSGDERLAAGRWYLRGRLAQSEGNLDEAASYLRAYHESSPGYLSVTRLADVLQQDGRTGDLLALTRQYVADAPDDYSARLALALRLASEHPELALELLKDSHADWLVRRSWQLSNNVAWLHLQQNKPEAALPYAANALALKPEHPTVQNTHAQVLLAVETEAEKDKQP